MDIDLEIGSDEGNSPEPIFHSIINAMGSKKEATADQIYNRIQQEGMTMYSKPQVDRALANALQYGIFEVRNNRYRMRDDILDDDDTIYCQAHIKREKTPYRLENNQKDYINPEKDQHKFRRLYVKDGEECYSSINQTEKPKQSSGAQAKRMVRTEQKRKVKRRKKEWNYNLVEGKYPNDKKQYWQAYKSDSSSMSDRRVRQKRKNTIQNNNGSKNYKEYDNRKYGHDEKNEVEDEDEEQDVEGRTGVHQCENKIPHSSYLEYMKKPYALKFSSKKMILSDHLREDDFNRQENVSDIRKFEIGKNFENRYWYPTLLCSKWNLGNNENNRVGTWSGNADWLINRPENTQDGTVKQFNNALKIEPLDSLPSENMEEPSYIS